MRVALRDRAEECVAGVVRALQDATCGVDAQAATLHQPKTLVFLSRCSNPDAVFAIPADTLRLRHSLRLGGQHGEEAKDEDEVSGEKGRKEDQAPEEEVTRAASQSSTSNDVDDCVTRAGVS